MDEKYIATKGPCKSIDDYIASVKTNKTVYDVFPSAEEMAKLRDKANDEITLWKIFNMFKTSEDYSICWGEKLSENCIKFLQDKGYSIMKVPDPLNDFTGDDKWAYDISCKR